MKLKRKITSTKRQKKTQKNDNQIGKNNILWIWIEDWNWKPKVLQKDQWKKLEIKWIRTKLKKIIYDKLGLSDEIENK